MYIRTIDGVVQFATHFIYVDIPIEQRHLFFFQTEQNGIVCYSEEEKNQAENLLNQYSISHTIEPTTFTDEQKQKVANKKFNSRTEAIQYLQGEIEEPESEIIPKLQREKEQLQQQLQQTEDALLTIMFGG